jgi:hypothetical protein
MSSSDEVASKRDSAQRARRLALQLMNEMDRARILAFADQLEAEADALEGGHPQPPPPQVTHVQQQPQQQATQDNSDEKPGEQPAEQPAEKPA